MGSAAQTTPLRIERLSYSWPNGQSALSQCQLEIPRPGLWMLVGTNGSGKSTLLRLIAGLLEAKTGQISTPLKPALVFQNPDHQLLLPSCSSELLLSLPGGLGASERKKRLEQALQRVGLAGFQQRPIHTLSGGQKQRLAIAGALASEAGLLLLDEPTALLDPQSQREALELIYQLSHPGPQHSQPAITALWITHRLEELRRCDGAALMEHGRIGPWQNGAELAQQLATPLQGGRVER
ncbi:ABC transporter ATP-binding protein [Cyanobium sp. HWJ4-Hawea]|uniref:ABC transporter ATP-binding protein n=1 Tax=unclassified Cyanobium TaxID=2627006 RepID=UPI0020CFBB4E|nr:MULTISPECIES: ABC transporter ATP-binding protein [unclassified Cyanobium]MCP9775313.1 ABC transporter ATP-binding protein [Cyanobium sp. WAJ14-Wanaka]MCP9810161.1 ABC transporter ATP-binding protein [Cyanobium sp. HWJ4-Hawea]